MRIYYDLHLHSCLSPCGSDDMTPANLVNMAKLLGFDMIALTDHNSCRNVPAAVAAGKEAGIIVVPGMELCTEEEAHVVCLFPNVETSLEFSEFVREKSAQVENRPEIFGNQLVVNERDEVVDREEILLINAAGISVNEVSGLVRQRGGTAFPAHVDKSAYSVISNLGAVPPEAEFTAAEISPRGNVREVLEHNPELKELLLLTNSDAHYLENMLDPKEWLDLPECSIPCFLEVLNGRKEGKSSINTNFFNSFLA